MKPLRTTTTGQSEPVSKGNEERIPDSPDLQNWNLATRCSSVSNSSHHFWKKSNQSASDTGSKIYVKEVCCMSFQWNYHFIISNLGCPRGVMVKAMDCGIVVREFVLQSRYYVDFRANTLGKGMNPLILPAMG